MKGNPKRVITLRVTPEEEQQLLAFAKQHQQTRSAVLIDGAKLLILMKRNKNGAIEIGSDPTQLPRLI